MSHKYQKKQLLPVFLLIDTSGSMTGVKIEQVKTALEEIRFQLEALNDEMEDSEIRVSIMTFDTECKWISRFKRPNEINTHLDLGVLTAMGAAFKELNGILTQSQLTKNGYYNSVKSPIIILLTDGCAVDDYEIPLRELKRNNWFLRSYRFAFGLGDAADMECVEKFTGSINTVLSVDNSSAIVNLLPEIIHSLSMASTATHNIYSEENKNNEELFIIYAKKAEQAVNGMLNNEVSNNNSIEEYGSVVKGFSIKEKDVFNEWK